MRMQKFTPNTRVTLRRVAIEVSVLCLITGVGIAWATYVPQARTGAFVCASIAWSAGVVLAIAFRRSAGLWLKCILIGLAILGVIPLVARACDCLALG
jgi:hypothetical protein